MRSTSSPRAVSRITGDLRGLADRAAEAEPVFARHHDVEHDQIDGRGLHHLAGDGGVGRRGGAIAVLAQIARERFADVARILDHEGYAAWLRL